MTDTYGANTIPLTPPATEDDSLGDPGLDYLGQYLGLVLPALAGAAWAEVVSSDPIILNTFKHDPEKGQFDDNALPALYLWSDAVEPNKRDGWVPVTDSGRVTESVINILWVFPPSEPTLEDRLQPLLRGFSDCLDVAFYRGRDPLWVIPNDPDETAEELGSVLPRWCGWSKYELQRVLRAEIVMHYVDSKEVTKFHGIKAELRVATEHIPDPATLGYPLVYAGEITATDGTFLTPLEEPADDPMWPAGGP